MENPMILPNNNVYLNHLSSDKAAQFEFARNCYLAIVGIIIWDILVYTPDDVRIVLKGFNAVTFCFVFSRIFTVVYALVFIFMQTHEIEDCRAVSIGMHIVCVLSMTCASFLFLRRLHAVYNHNRIVRWIFTFLWVGMTACGIPTLVGFHMEHIPGTDLCTPYEIEKYVSIIDFFPAAFDTLIYFTISYRLFVIHRMVNETASWKDIITGKALPGLLCVLLQGGQQYYLIVFGVAIVSGAIIYAPPSISGTYGLVVALASTTLTTSMACRVFRKLKTFENEHHPKSSLLPTISSIRFAPPVLSEDKRDNQTGTTSGEVR